MIILDTNVVSEPMKPEGDPIVLAWLDRQSPETLFVSATSLSELLVGIEMIPAGKRRRGLADLLTALIERLFRERILPFDREAAKAYASLVSRARANGIAIAVADGQIAAIAEVRGFAVASRNTAPFLAAGSSLIHPWEE